MIDWNRVAVLRSEVGAEGFDDVVTIFLEEADEVVDRLAASPRIDRLEDDLHLLKGSALCFGFKALSDLCQSGETLSANGAAEQVDLPRILHTYQISKQGFLSELPMVFDCQISL